MSDWKYNEYNKYRKYRKCNYMYLKFLGCRNDYWILYFRFNCSSLILIEKSFNRFQRCYQRCTITFKNMYLYFTVDYLFCNSKQKIWNVEKDIRTPTRSHWSLRRSTSAFQFNYYAKGASQLRWNEPFCGW